MRRNVIAVVSAELICAGCVLGQDSFQNLDFESARVNLDFGTVATSNAMPGWTAFGGTNQLSTVGYNLFAVVPDVQLFGSNGLVISGNFSVALLSGWEGAISQTGLVPDDAQLLLFKGRWTGSAPLHVSLGGRDLPHSVLSSGSDYTLYGADVSAFAGQTATLRFSAPPWPVSVTYYVIDEIQFAVPEPSAMAMFGLGTVFLAARRLRKRSSPP